MFRPPEALPFNVATLIQQSILDWHGSKDPSVPLPETEGVGDFIVAQMENCLLRRSEGGAAVFEADASAEVYRRCVFLALDRWLEEDRREPTREERDAYLAVDESCGPTVLRKRKALTLPEPAPMPPGWEDQNESPIQVIGESIFKVFKVLLVLLTIAVVLWLRFAK